MRERAISYPEIPGYGNFSGRSPSLCRPRISLAKCRCRNDLVNAVLQAAKGESRAILVTFRGVVENNIEDDFNIRPVQCLHHVAEFIHSAKWILPRTVGGCGAKNETGAYPQ